jgi:hypothetical protein
MGGYIVTYDHGSSFPRIVGRVFGQEGYAHYQIAARPHDEVSVGPFADRQAAFDKCVKVLERRRTRTFDQAIDDMILGDGSSEYTIAELREIANGTARREG